ncbi:hypothetical protein Taro_021592 [Colocasia esculenta]|uniref:FAR1 domain-containing protein n=1 Tax=Colocasia esculenta TaxID=4460 RepID=A0A843V8P2_COLES|nr:hypothetical protein [Colocasia esculenta]
MEGRAGGAGLQPQQRSREPPSHGGEDSDENRKEGSAASASAAAKRRRRDLIESIWEANQGPYEGMEFETREAAHVFYNEYARRVGFGTRVGSVRYSQRSHAVIAQTYVCSKQGSAKPGKRPGDAGAGAGDSREIRRRVSIRSGCRALISLKKREDTGKWVVYRVEKHHNHPLVAPENVHYIRSHKPFSLCRGARHFFHPASSPPREDAAAAGAVLSPSTPTPRQAGTSKSKPLHVLTVFRIANVLVLPSQYISKRWSRNAKTGDVLDDQNVELHGNSRESLTLRYNNLRHLAINFVEEGASSMEIYDVAIAVLREAGSKVLSAKKNFTRVPRVPHLGSSLFCMVVN